MAMNHFVSFLALESRQNLHSKSRLSPSRLGCWRSFRNKDQTVMSILRSSLLIIQYSTVQYSSSWKYFDEVDFFFIKCIYSINSICMMVCVRPGDKEFDNVVPHVIYILYCRQAREGATLSERTFSTNCYH